MTTLLALRRPLVLISALACLLGGLTAILGRDDATATPTSVSTGLGRHAGADFVGFYVTRSGAKVYCLMPRKGAPTVVSLHTVNRYPGLSAASSGALGYALATWGDAHTRNAAAVESQVVNTLAGNHRDVARRNRHLPASLRRLVRAHVAQARAMRGPYVLRVVTPAAPLPGGAAVGRVQLGSAMGRPLAGIRVVLRATANARVPAAVRTDRHGRASFRYEVGDIGEVRVAATAGGLPATAVRVSDPRPGQQRLAGGSAGVAVRAAAAFRGTVTGFAHRYDCSSNCAGRPPVSLSACAPASRLPSRLVFSVAGRPVMLGFAAAARRQCRTITRAVPDPRGRHRQVAVPNRARLVAARRRSRHVHGRLPGAAGRRRQHELRLHASAGGGRAGPTGRHRVAAPRSSRRIGRQDGTGVRRAWPAGHVGGRVAVRGTQDADFPKRRAAARRRVELRAPGLGRHAVTPRAKRGSAGKRCAVEQKGAAREEIGEVIGVVFAGQPMLDARRVVQRRVAPPQVDGRGGPAGLGRAAGRIEIGGVRFMPGTRDHPGTVQRKSRTVVRSRSMIGTSPAAGSSRRQTISMSSGSVALSESESPSRGVSTPAADASAIERLMFEVKRVIVGQERLVERLVVSLLAQGHCLLEGVPGVAKTLAVETLAKTVTGTFSRLQFTPDLVPSDIVGTRIYRPGAEQFDTELGPIMANFVLADEINRAPAKVQSALLEVMAERHVTIGGKQFDVPKPFLVLATQNPIESEGVYPLPEAQRDRFLMKVVVDYPSAAEEREIIYRMGSHPPVANAVISTDDLQRLQATSSRVFVHHAIVDYVVRLVLATRNPQQLGLNDVKQWVSYGASPRASLGLIAAGRALALTRGRDYVLPQDVLDIAVDVLAHRMVLSYDAIADGVPASHAVRRVLQAVPLPQVASRQRAGQPEMSIPQGQGAPLVYGQQAPVQSAQQSGGWGERSA